MNRLLTALGSTAALLVASQPAASQMVCGNRVEIVDALQEGHSEQRTAAGISGNGGLVELFTGEKGSWTLLMTIPGGPTCLIGAGEEWEGFERKELPKKPHSTAVTPPLDHT